MAKVRTQIQLERRQYERLKRLALERGQSLSAVLRALVDDALGGGAAAGAGAVREARLGFVGSGRDREGKRDVARLHDRYLYGDHR
ncbi:MAG: ribbon-helix-helix protein, CopG family [Actinomycetota bacterium]